MIHSGFNLPWLCQQQAGASGPDKRVLDAIAGWGFNFVRLPMDYRLWSVGGDPCRPDESVLRLIDDAVTACCSRGLHLSLNLHRAPGYVVAGGENEPMNLWADRRAQDAFVVTWERFAQRYRYVPRAVLSFDLVDTPPAPGLRGFTRQAHEQVIRRTVAAIRAVAPDRPLIVDGLDGGNLAMPELADLDVTQSTRGYQPMGLSHYRAPWWPGGQGLGEPHHPALDNGRRWDREGLRDFYTPWRDLERLGVPVHVGEVGCYEHTPDEVAQAWFDDLFTVFAEFGWGFALWEFAGPFGIVGHRRPGAVFERRGDLLVDVRMLERMQEAHEAAGSLVFWNRPETRWFRGAHRAPARIPEVTDETGIATSRTGRDIDDQFRGGRRGLHRHSRERYRRLPQRYELRLLQGRWPRLPQDGGTHAEGSLRKDFPQHFSSASKHRGHTREV